MRVGWGGGCLCVRTGGLVSFCCTPCEADQHPPAFQPNPADFISFTYILFNFAVGAGGPCCGRVQHVLAAHVAQLCLPPFSQWPLCRRWWVRSRSSSSPRPSSGSKSISSSQVQTPVREKRRSGSLHDGRGSQPAVVHAHCPLLPHECLHTAPARVLPQAWSLPTCSRGYRSGQLGCCWFSWPFMISWRCWCREGRSRCWWSWLRSGRKPSLPWCTRHGRYGGTTRRAAWRHRQRRARGRRRQWWRRHQPGQQQQLLQHPCRRPWRQRGNCSKVSVGAGWRCGRWQAGSQ